LFLKSSTLGVIGLATRRRWRRPARAVTDQRHVAKQWGPFGRRYGGHIAYFRFNEPEVVFRERILAPRPSGEASRAIGRPHGPKYCENHRPGGTGGQTGSRNMAATNFFDSATPTSYSTPNTLWGLARTVTELPGGNVSITPLLRPSDIFASL